MRDSLSYRISDDGEGAFNQAVARAKKWIGTNINGPLKLTFAISLKAVASEGESVQEIRATDNLPLTNDSGKKSAVKMERDNLDLSNACARRHHAECKYEQCECDCHEGRSAETEV